MNQEETETPASGEETEKKPEQEPAPGYADIVIYCHQRNVGNLVQALEDQIKHAAGALPTFVFWSGQSGLLHMGVVVLEWEGPMDPEFLHNLSIDHEIFDYIIYSWTSGKEEEKPVIATVEMSS